MSETVSWLIELFRFLHRLETYRIMDEVIASPRLSLVILKICTSILCFNRSKCLPIRITAFFSNHISQILSHTENIFHNSGRIFEYIVIYSLQNITQLIFSIYRHIYCICLIDMSFTKWLYIAALCSKTKRIQCIFKISVLAYSIYLSSSRKYNFALFYFSLWLNCTVRLYHTSKTDMCAASHKRIMVHYSSTVYQNTMLNHSICVHYRILHNKTSLANLCTRAYYCRRMNNCRNIVSSLHQLFCPIQTHSIISKTCHCSVILFQKCFVITAFPYNICSYNSII